MGRNSSNKSNKSNKSDQKATKAAKESKKKESPKDKKTPPVEDIEGEAGTGKSPQVLNKKTGENAAPEQSEHPIDIPEGSGSQFNVDPEPIRKPSASPPTPPGLDIAETPVENGTEISTENSFVVVKQKPDKKPADKNTAEQIHVILDSSDEEVPKSNAAPKKKEEDNRSNGSDSSEKSRNTRASHCTQPADYGGSDEEAERKHVHEEEQEEEVVVVEPVEKQRPPPPVPKRKVELKPNNRAFQPIGNRAPPDSRSPNYEKASLELSVLSEQVRLLTQQAQQHQQAQQSHFYPQHNYYPQQHTAPFNQFHAQVNGPISRPMGLPVFEDPSMAWNQHQYVTPHAHQTLSSSFPVSEGADGRISSGSFKYNNSDLISKMDDKFVRELERCDLPNEIICELAKYSIYNRDELVPGLKNFDIKEVVTSACPNRNASDTNSLIVRLNLLYNKVSDEKKSNDLLEEEKRKQDAKKNRVDEKRLEALLRNYSTHANTIVLDYVRPSAELVGIIEPNFHDSQYKYVHVTSIRNVQAPDASQEEHGQSAASKNYYRKHLCCFLQRVETLLNAYLVLSYEKVGTDGDTSELLLTKEKADLYLNTLRRYAVFSGCNDSWNSASDVIKDIDHEWRQYWAEATPQDQDGNRTKLDDIIMNQIENKISKNAFIQKVKIEKDRNSANCTGAWKENYNNNNNNSDSNTTPKKNNRNKNRKNNNSSSWYSNNGKRNRNSQSSTGPKNKRQSTNNWKNNNDENYNNDNKNSEYNTKEYTYPKENKNYDGKYEKKTEKSENNYNSKLCSYGKDCRFRKKCKDAHSMNDVIAWENDLFKEKTSSENRAAVFDQPNKQLPRLIPITSGCDTHLELARRVDLFSLFSNTDDRADTSGSSFVCGTPPETVKKLRKKTLEEIKRLKKSVAPLNAKFQMCATTNESAHDIDLALLDALMNVTCAPDTELVKDLILGMPLSGMIPAAPSLRRELPREGTTIDKILMCVEKTNARVLSNLYKQSPEDRQTCFDITHQEILDKKVSTLREATQEDLKSKILTPRFIVHQGKPRIIDNLKASRVNETAMRNDTYVPDTLDKLMIKIRSLKISLDANKRDDKILAYSFDFKSAYKHIGIDEKSKIAAHIVIIDPLSMKPMIGEMLCQPFGSALSPRNWGRVVETIKFLCRKLFRIDTFYFVDDGFGAEPSSTATNAFESTIALATLLGFKIHPDKLTSPTETLKLLGAIITITDKQIIVKNPKTRIRKIRNTIAKILVSKRLTPANAASIRGKIGFAQSLLFGRVGRSKVHELIKRQYVKKVRTVITKPLAKELKWWFKNIEKIPHRYLPIKNQGNHVIYSDASGEGGICLGTIIIESHATPPFLAYSGTQPEWMGKQNIFVLEILAAAIAIQQLADINPQGIVLIFIDNTAAASALIRGSTECEIACDLISAFWNVCKKSRLIPWIEIVKSENNPADAPSRGTTSSIPIVFGSLNLPTFLNSREALNSFANS